MKKNKSYYLKLLIKNLFIHKTKKMCVPYPEYDNDFKIKRIKSAIDNNLLTKEACSKALNLSCNIDKHEISNLTEELFKDITDIKVEKNSEDILISFIIPTHNRKKELNECLQSILEQTYKNYEIIIIDDKSTDNTEEFIKENYSKNPNIRYYKNNKNKGSSYNRKFGFMKSNGKYVIFCDDDDFYIDSYFLQRAVNILKENSEEKISLLAFTSFLYSEKNKLLTRHVLNSNYLNENAIYIKQFLIKYKKPLSTFTTLFLKESLENNGLDNMQIVDDTSIYLCGLLSDKSIISNQVVGIYRVTQSNISSNMPVSFIINLLKEVKNISLKLKDKDVSIDIDVWWEKKVLAILTWAITKRYHSLLELLKILNFIDKNTNKNKAALKKKIIIIWLEA